MEKGHIVRRLENEAAPQIIAFDRYAVDINQLEQRADQVVVVRPRERYTNELLKPDPNDTVFKMSPGSYASELHERLASPLYTIRLRADGAGVHGTGADHAHEPHAGASSAPLPSAYSTASSASPRPTTRSCTPTQCHCCMPQPPSPPDRPRS